jgi:hypothetical protein
VFPPYSLIPSTPNHYHHKKKITEQFPIPPLNHASNYTASTSTHTHTFTFAFLNTYTDITLWETFTSLGLASLIVYQCLASSLVFYRLVRALLDQQRIEASTMSPFTATAIAVVPPPPPPAAAASRPQLPLQSHFSSATTQNYDRKDINGNEHGGGNDGDGEGGGDTREETRMLNGIAWYTVGIHLGMVETAVGFADASFGTVVARRIIRFVSRAFLVVGMVKG